MFLRGLPRISRRGGNGVGQKKAPAGAGEPPVDAGFVGR